MWSNCILCIPFILSASSKRMLAAYMQRMRNNNLASVVQKLDITIHRISDLIYTAVLVILLVVFELYVALFLFYYFNKIKMA